jgi:hypothetical protein
LVYINHNMINTDRHNFPIVVDSFSGIYSSLLLLGFTKSSIKLKVYEPTYRMGPVGFEPTTASAPGLYLLIRSWYPGPS